MYVSGVKIPTFCYELWKERYSYDYPALLSFSVVEIETEQPVDTVFYPYNFILKI